MNKTDIAFGRNGSFENMMQLAEQSVKQSEDLISKSNSRVENHAGVEQPIGGNLMALQKQQHAGAMRHTDIGFNMVTNIPLGEVKEY